MRENELPSPHRLYSDWLSNAPAARDFLPPMPTLARVRERAAIVLTRQYPRTEIQRLLAAQADEHGAQKAAFRNIERILQPESCVVLVGVPAAFAAGPLALLLKCLTAVKIAAETERAGIPSIPLCWLSPDPLGVDDSLAISMPGRTGELSRVELHPPVDGNDSRAVDWPVPEEIGASLRLLESSLTLQPDDQILQELRSAFAPGTPYRRACARFIAARLGELGVVLLDPLAADFRALALSALEGSGLSFEDRNAVYYRQEERLREAGYSCALGNGKTRFKGQTALDIGNSVEELAEGVSSGAFAHLLLEDALPVAAHVIDQPEICAFALAAPVFKERNLPPPVLWPRASATLVDARNSKIMEKYGINLSDVHSGKSQVLRGLTREDSAAEVISRLDALERLIDKTFEDIRAALAPGNALGDLPNETRSRMRFQLAKLTERYAAATNLRRETIERQIDRLYASLVPAGRLQEEVIAGVYFMLRNSDDFLTRLYNALNVESFAHQLIPVE